MKKITKIFAIMIFMLLCTTISIFAADDGAYVSVDGIKMPVYTLQKAGNDNENFVILFMGDGFTADEQELFLSKVTKYSDTMMSTDPFSRYADKISVYAVSVISNESGVSVSGNEKDTYFKVEYTNSVNFKDGNKDKAEAVKAALEKDFLDNGAVVGTTHILVNSKARFGSSKSAFYSFSSITDECPNGEAMIHEIAHSIGRLDDEYRVQREWLNTTKEKNPETVKWKQFLGFRSVGIVPNGQGTNAYIPSPSCIMLYESAGSFCEVCKLELVKRMNLSVFTQKPAKYYVALPDLTIEHTYEDVGKQYEKYQIINGNLMKAKRDVLEFRTVVQNLTTEEQHIKLTLQIIDENGNDKYYTEQEFAIPPVPENALYEYEFEPSKQSVSVKLSNMLEMTHQDKVLGKVIDCETNEVIATDKTARLTQHTVNIHHKIKASDGSVYEMPNTMVTKIPLKEGETYTPKALKQLNGYIYTGNSLTGESITMANEDTDIDFYYKTAEPAAWVDISENGKSFVVNVKDIRDGNAVILALYDGKNCVMSKHLYMTGAK